MKQLLIIIALLNLLSVAAGKNSLNVFLEKCDPNCSPHNSSFYTIAADNIDHLMIKLKCSAELPNRWIIWNLGRETDDLITVKKVRKRKGNETTFISYLIYSLPSDTDVAKNFSCLYEKEWNLGRNKKTFANVISSTVEIKQIFDDSETAKLINTTIHIRNNKSLDSYFSSDKDKNSCSNNLTVDLKNGSAPVASYECNFKKDAAKTWNCSDLDKCESLPLSFMTWETRKCKGRFLNLDASITKRHLHTGNRVLPIIIFCDASNIYWTSYLILYPSFEQPNSKILAFYSSMEEAVKANSIRIQHSTSKTLVFAENETVEFECVAVQYLYMEGLQWLIGFNNQDPKLLHDSKEAETENGLLVVKRNITLSSRNVSSISCQGPLWNSEKMQTARINITVYASTPPTGKIYIKDDQITCEYRGWPRPVVTWKFTNNVTACKPIENIHGSGIAPKVTWNESCLVLPQSTTYTVICILKNLRGSPSYNITFESSKLKGTSDSKTLSAVVITLSLIVFVISLASVVLYWRYRRKSSLYAHQQQLTLEEINEFYKGAKNNSTTYEALLLPYNPDLEIDHAELTLDGSILGSGQFGLVLKGRIGDLCVAVKTVKPNADLIYLKSLLSELKVLQYVGPHRNIVNLIGANTANIRKREVFLVLDYCSNGDLVNFLRQCRDRFVNFFSNSSSTEKKSLPLYENKTEITLTTGNLIMFAYEMASAMDHLSSKNVIHGDLAARNVLITDDFHAKICDFGLAKQLLHYSVYVQKIDLPLPLRWMAVESLQDMEFSLASDKWSFAVCLWEIFSLGETPYPGVSWSFESYKMLQEGYRMEKPQFANDSIYRLMLQCWNAQPLERPTFQYIINELKKEEDMLT